MYWGLVGASAVAFSGATDFMPEMNRWLQIVEMDGPVRLVTFVHKFSNLTVAVTCIVQSEVD